MSYSPDFFMSDTTVGYLTFSTGMRLFYCGRDPYIFAKYHLFKAVYLAYTIVEYSGCKQKFLTYISPSMQATIDAIINTCSCLNVK